MPDTHNPAVQASAARLAQLLKETYTWPEEKPGAQLFLIQYLQHQLGRCELSEGEIKAVKECKSISASVKFIDWVSAYKEPSPDEPSPEDLSHADQKKRFYEQMLVLVSICPGIHWDDNHKQWSTNKFYNPETEKNESSLTSVAEALNLVCHALFDLTRYASQEGKEEEDLQDRLRNAYGHLVELRKATESGNLEKCSAGLQHDVFYWLNAGFLNRPKTEKEASPVVLLMGTPEFITESLVEFINEQIKLSYAEGMAASTDKMLEAWIKGGNNSEPHPLERWLQQWFTKEIDVDWKDVCEDYLKERCKQFWINPDDCDLSGYIKAISSISPPAPDNIVIVIKDIWQMKEVNLPMRYPKDSIYTLMAWRNQVLNDFKKNELQALKRLNPDIIRNFFSLIATVDDIYRYRDITLLMDKNTEKLVSASKALQVFLLNTLPSYDVTKPLSPDYEKLKSDYAIQKQAFTQTANHIFISNFFAIQNGTQSEWDNAWNQLQALNGSDEASAHPLIFTDEQLTAWQKNAESISEDGRVLVELSPYAINRLFLHGLLVPQQQWSALYSYYLKTVTEWLLHASQEEANLQALSHSYPGYFLSNMLALSLLQLNASPELNGVMEALISEKYNLVKDSVWIEVLKCSDDSLNTVQKALILEAVKDNLAALIKDGWQLKDLLALPSENLNAAQKTLIWEAVKDKLSTLI